MNGIKKEAKMTKSTIVYSTESGRICPDCNKPVSSCVCKKKKYSEGNRSSRNWPDDGIIRIMRETKGHGGKTITIIGNIPLENSQLKELAKKLKTRCGAGGSIKDGEIIIQGDHRKNILDELTRQGYRVKLAGDKLFD